jgi:hypothetical protein
MNVDEWLQRVATHLGHGLISLIDYEDQAFVDYRLLNLRSNAGPGSGTNGTNARLTDFGLRLCEMIENYEEAVLDMPV